MYEGNVVDIGEVADNKENNPLHRQGIIKKDGNNEPLDSADKLLWLYEDLVEVCAGNGDSSYTPDIPVNTYAKETLDKGPTMDEDWVMATLLAEQKYVGQFYGPKTILPNGAGYKS